MFRKLTATLLLIAAPAIASSQTDTTIRRILLPDSVTARRWEVDSLRSAPRRPSPHCGMREQLNGGMTGILLGATTGAALAAIPAGSLSLAGKHRAARAVFWVPVASFAEVFGLAGYFIGTLDCL